MESPVVRPGRQRHGRRVSRWWLILVCACARGPGPTPPTPPEVFSCVSDVEDLTPPLVLVQGTTADFTLDVSAVRRCSSTRPVGSLSFVEVESASLEVFDAAGRPVAATLDTSSGYRVRVLVPTTTRLEFALRLEPAVALVRRSLPVVPEPRVAPVREYGRACSWLAPGRDGALLCVDPRAGVRGDDGGVLGQAVIPTPAGTFRFATGPFDNLFRFEPADGGAPRDALDATKPRGPVVALEDSVVFMEGALVRRWFADGSSTRTQLSEQSAPVTAMVTLDGRVLLGRGERSDELPPSAIGAPLNLVDPLRPVVTRLASRAGLWQLDPAEVQLVDLWGTRRLASDRFGTQATLRRGASGLVVEDALPLAQLGTRVGDAGVVAAVVVAPFDGGALEEHVLLLPTGARVTTATSDEVFFLLTDGGLASAPP